MKCNLRLLTIILMLASWSTQAQTTTVFSYTGTVQTFTVPVGCTSLGVDVAGAAGGNSSSGDVGGCGGRVQATMAVTPGQVLNIYVGSIGSDGSSAGGGAGGKTGPTVSGGAGGGTPTTYYYYYYTYGSGAGGGGGASDIRIGGLTLADRVVAAGAGGGGGIDCAFSSNAGGDGGGPGTAGNGLACGVFNPTICGAGGSTVGGGLGGGGGGAGGALLGGAGTTGTVSTYYYYYYYFTATAGGGGGAGYFGGGGASGGGGGGGSSYTNPLLTSAVTSTQGFCTPTGDGWVKITVPCVTPVGGVILGPPVACVGSTITYTDPTGTPGGTWSSSNLGVATVNPLTGGLYGVAPGITTLTYTISTGCGTASTSSVITIVNSPTAIFGNTSVCLGNVDTLFDTTAGGTWTSGSTGVATIDPVTGIVTTVGPGTSLITYSAGSCTATTTLTVNPLPSAIVGPTAVCRFSTITLTDLGSPGGTWSSTVPLAASVGPTGIVTGVGPGGSATNILYTLPTGCSVAHFVSVTTPPLPIAGPGQVCASNAIILTELVGGGTWATSAPLVASVTSGVVTGLTQGVTTIVYTMPSCPPVTHIVTVNPEPSAIYGPTAVCVSMTTTLIDTTAGGSWSSLNPLITVGSTGVVTSSTSGISGTIIYTLPTTCYTEVTVNVSVPPSAIIGPSNVCQGQNVTLVDTTPGGLWSSTNLAIARIVDTSGVDSGISAGLVNISYTLPSGCFAEMPFVVNPPVTPGVVINSPATLVCSGTPDTFIATPVNGGLPTYQWTKFSAPFSPAQTNDTLIYTPIHGDVINCVMVASGVCALNDTATDTFVVNVYPTDMAPGITIMTGNADTVAYVGEVVTFFSSVTWGGTSPTYQWYMNHVAIPGATGSSYTTPVYESDTFYCIVNGNPPCESSTPNPGISNPIIIHDYLGVNPLTANGNTFSLFPNPNNGSFTLSGTLANVTNNEVNYQVVDMLGQIVYSGKTTPQNGKIKVQITLGDLASGSYMLRVNTDNSSETFHFVIGK